MNETTAEPEWREIAYTSHDGLRLYARHYPARSSEKGSPLPLLCLPGLTRNSKDFHVLAVHMSNSSSSAPRDVYCLDYRGRGESDYDSNWRNYSPYIEMLDTLDFMSLMELERVDVLGTSRGGIIAMLMAVVRPGTLGAVILNDIGPVIETRGLARIIGYVGKTPTPRTWEEAALIIRDMSARFFTHIRDDEWMELARQWYGEEDGLPVPGYDPNLARTMAQIDLGEPIPRMWPQFDALRHVPVMVLRGENSDLLTPETVAEMSRRHPGIKAHIVREEGHAPFLRDRRTLRAIESFLLEAERSELGELLTA